MNTPLRPRTVKLLSRLMKPLVDEGVILVSEEQTIFANLKHLADKGKLMPEVVPKLIDQKAAAEMIGVGHSNFKKLESEGAFPFSRRIIGRAVRYRNTDIVKYIMTEENI